MGMGTGVGTKMRREGMGASGIESGNIVNCLKLFCELSFQNVSSLLTNHVSPNFDYK